MITYRREKIKYRCEKCHNLFEINFRDTDGKYKCLFDRKYCLQCSPPRKSTLPFHASVIENYPKYGNKWCQEKYNLTKNQVAAIVTKYKLYVYPEANSKIQSECRRKSEYDHKVQHSRFINIDTALDAYILGLLWTDGHVSKTTNTIVFSTTMPDGNYFIPLFLKTGKWSVFTAETTTKPKVSIYTSNRFLKEYLKNYNFIEKEKGMDLIYNAIPEKFRKYFIIGMIDGDGCFYVNKKRGDYRFSICSSYNQNWECIERLCETLKIKYYIERCLSKHGNYSKLHIPNKYATNKLGSYIYDDYAEINLGLPRKYNKFLEITERCKLGDLRLKSNRNKLSPVN